MFNMKLRAAMFGLGIFAASAAMEDTAPGDGSPVRKRSSASAAIRDLEQKISDESDRRATMVSVDLTSGAVNQAKAEDLHDPSAEPIFRDDITEGLPKDKLSNTKKFMLGVGFTAFTAGGLFTGLAIGDIMQEMSKTDLDGKALDVTPDHAMLFTGIGCLLLAGIIFYVMVSGGNKGVKTGAGFFAAATLITGVVGTLMMVCPPGGTINKAWVYIPFAVAAVSSVAFIISMAIVLTKTYNIRALTTVFAAVATISLGGAAALVGANMQEAIHDMYGSQSFGMQTGGWAYGLIVGLMTVGLFSLWFTIIRATGGLDLTKKNGLLQVAALGCMAGVVAYTVMGINKIGEYASDMATQKTAGDGVDNICDAPLKMFMYAGIFLAVALLALLPKAISQCNKKAVEH